MKKLFLWLLILPTLVWAQTPSPQQEALDKLQWQVGPTSADITARAKMTVPEGYVFLGEADTSKFLEINGNPPRNGHYMVGPKSLQWFAVFSFEESGYVKDDEKIDPDALLQSLQESDGPGNEERKRLGMESIYTDGWQVAPHYDTQSKHLEWGVRLRTEDGKSLVNYTSRLLGRKGVMSAVLVSSPQTLAQDTSDFKQVLGGYAFQSGEKYTEFTQGDRVAEYGLAALVLGGAAAVATKKGLWGVIGGFLAAFWKVIAGLAVAAVAGFKSLFSKKKDS